jgi:hypothetical protein
MSCHPPTRQVGPFRAEDGPHDEPTEQLALTDLHVKPYAERHVKVYADRCPPEHSGDGGRVSAAAALGWNLLGVEPVGDRPDGAAVPVEPANAAGDGLLGRVGVSSLSSGW